MERAVLRLWRPVLEELQSMPLDDGGLVAHSKENWVLIGSYMGLSPEKYHPMEEQATSVHKARHVPYKRCQWRDCFCTYHQPEHSMRVCKGCWKSRYCSKKCQKRCVASAMANQLEKCTDIYMDSDWREGGHRAWCLPRT